MVLTNLLTQITKNSDDLQIILEYERASFENKFLQFKERILNNGGNMQQYQQTGRQGEEPQTEDTGSECASDSEDLQEELEDTKRQLECERSKNRELDQDVIDLHALVDLYVKEAQRREELEEKWREGVTEKLRRTVRNLEDEVLRKMGDIDNLQNIIMELRSELNRKDEEILGKNERIKILQIEIEVFKVQNTCKAPVKGEREE